MLLEESVVIAVKCYDGYYNMVLLEMINSDMRLLLISDLSGVLHKYVNASVC